MTKLVYCLVESFVVSVLCVSLMAFIGKQYDLSLFFITWITYFTYLLFFDKRLKGR